MLGALSLCHLLNDMVQSLLPAIYPILKTALQPRLPPHRAHHARQPADGVAAAAGGRATTRIAGRSRSRSPSGMTFTLWRAAAARVVQATSASCSLAAALIGIGSSIFHPESSRIARLASGGQHGLAQSLFQVGGNAGSALGPLLAAFIVLPRGQRSLAWFAVVPDRRDRAALARRPLVQPARARRRPPREAAATRRITASTRRQVIGALAVLLVLVFSKYIYLASLSTYYTVLSDRHVPRLGAERAAAPVRVPRRRGGRHDPRRARRRSVRPQVRDLGIDPRRAAVHARAAVREPVWSRACSARSSA